MRSMAIGLTLAILAGPAFAQTALGDAAIQELGCRRTPNPTPIIRALVDAKLIRLADQKGYDSVSCWRLRQPLDLRGLAITGMCASEENQLIRQQNPKFYWRGPGTSPGTLISVATSASPATVKAWAAANLGAGKAQVDKSEAFNGMTQIECNSYFQ